MTIKTITPQIAAMYLGQTWESKNGKTMRLVGVQIGVSHQKPLLCEYEVFGDWARLRFDCDEILPHLRRLESMTEAEGQTLYDSTDGTSQFSGDFAKMVVGLPLVWLKLLEMGFDLFGLIEAGFAKEIGS